MNNHTIAHELALIQNDLSRLKPDERLSLYNKTCESLGLNALTQPFGYIEFRGGKLSLYAKKDATDQLRKIHGVSVEISSKEIINDNYVVMAKAKDSSGRVDEDMGSVNIKGLHGDILGNAMMKAITKAKRRVTLSICGLGMLDENEVDTIPGATIAKDVPQIETKKAIVNHAPKAKEETITYKNFKFAHPKEFEGKRFDEIEWAVLDDYMNAIAWKYTNKDIPEKIQWFFDLFSEYRKSKGL